jgi:hypothetical protein
MRRTITNLANYSEQWPFDPLSIVGKVSKGCPMGIIYFDLTQFANARGAPIPNPINMALAGEYQDVYAALTAFAKDIQHIGVEQVESDNPN